MIGRACAAAVEAAAEAAVKSSCRRSGVSCGGIKFSPHVHVAGGLHAGCFPPHTGVLCGITGHMLYITPLITPHPTRVCVILCNPCDNSLVCFRFKKIITGCCILWGVCYLVTCGCVIFCRIRYVLSVLDQKLSGVGTLDS